MYTAKISGAGHYVPERIVTNDYLSTIIDTNDEWITERTGIRERRWVQEGDGNTAATMGTKAARKAIAAAGIEATEIGHIVFATISPDYYFPGCGVQVQEALDIGTIGATDIRNACSGFIYAMSIANAFVKSGMHEHVLVVASELQSPFIDKTTRGRNISVIFGDGAGAVVRSVACWAWKATPSTVTVITAAKAEKITLTAARRPSPRFSSPFTLGRRM